MKPELFLGWEEEPAAWQWFSQKTRLDDAVLSGFPLHAEHFTTCVANDERMLVAKLTALELEGEASGDSKRASKRHLNLRAQQEHEAVQAPTREVFQDSSPHFEAMDRSSQASGCSEQLPLF
jgi:hypothetical protein